MSNYAAVFSQVRILTGNIPSTDSTIEFHTILVAIGLLFR